MNNKVKGAFCVTKKWMLTAAFLGIGLNSAYAEGTKLGVHLGAYSAGTFGGLGGGVNFLTVPSDRMGFLVDLSTAILSSSATGSGGMPYYSTSPGVVYYFQDREEFRIGVVGGAGFYKVPTQRLFLGLHGGLVGDFTFTKNMVAGMETRYANLIGSSIDVVSVLLTFGWKFQGKGDW